MAASAMIMPPSRSMLAAILAGSTRIPRATSRALATAPAAAVDTTGNASHSACHSPAARSWRGCMAASITGTCAAAIMENPTVVSDEMGLTFWGMVEEAPRW